MAQGTSLSQTLEPGSRGVRTHILLIAAMALVTIVTMALLVVIVRERFRAQAVPQACERA